MSYLDTPRLVFSGQFQADPSTVNNDPFHFDTARFRSSYQLLQSGSGAERLVESPRLRGVAVLQLHRAAPRLLSGWHIQR